MSKAILLCGGLAGGVLLTLVVQSVLREAEELNTQRAPVRDEAAELRAENERLREEVAVVEKLKEERLELNRRLEDLEAAARRAEPPPPAPPAPEAPSDTPPTDDEIMKGVEAFGESLGAILRGGGGQVKKDIQALLARAGEHGVKLLVAKFEDDATDIGLRSVLAHALAQSGNPEAVATLTGILADPEAGMLEMRLATHGLAFSDAEGVDDALLGVAHKAADTGARANAAFGLARRKHPEGVGLYAKATDEAMANRDPAALQYLSGFFLLGDEGLPPMRERLLTYTEPQAVLTLIEILKMKGDKGAIGNLRKLAADEGRPESTRKAAEGALKVLEAAK